MGRLPGGRQFLLTWPFGWAADSGRRDFTALYLFDRAGVFLDAQIELLPADLRCGQLQPFLDARLAELGEVSFERIEVQPFQVERFGSGSGSSLNSTTTRTCGG